MVRNLAGRVVLITGGASGIGISTALRFAAEGSCIVVANIDEEGAKNVARQIGVRSVSVNVVDPAPVEAAIAVTVKRHGWLDVLVNNNGIESARAITREATLENWSNVIDVNLNCVFYGMKHGLAQNMGWPRR